MFILSKSNLGDWFVLNQLGKNVNMYFFRAFVKELRNELREKPKRTKSAASSATLKSPAVVKASPLVRSFKYQFFGVMKICQITIRQNFGSSNHHIYQSLDPSN